MEDTQMDVDAPQVFPAYNWPLLAQEKTKGFARAVDEEVKMQVIHAQCMYSSAALCKDPRFVTTCGAKGGCTKHAQYKDVFARENLEVDDPESYYLRPYPTRTSSGYFHFKRLGLFAHLTHSGFIVVGKLWHDVYAESLEGCDVKPDANYGSHLAPKRLQFNNERVEPVDMVALCQSQGLLYKVLPQEHLQYHYDITNLDSLPGEGFISFPQMLRDAPALYLHYWKVWNQHIARVKEWVLKRNSDPLKLYKETGVRAWINWDDVDKNAPLYGSNHVLVPPPGLREVMKRDFNPFAYCHRWVMTHCPSQSELPHFPPMYLLYPFDHAEADPATWKARFAADVRGIVKMNRSVVESYHYFMNNPLAMMQWVKFGNPEMFHVPRSDIPPLLRQRLGASEWHVLQ